MQKESGNRREGRQAARRMKESGEATGEEDRHRTSVTSEEPAAISGGFCAPFKNASYGDAERAEKRGSDKRSVESFANVHTSGPSGPTNP